MNRDIISPRTIGVVLVALLGVTVLASISAPAVQASNDTGLAQTDYTGAPATNDSGMAFQHDAPADCTRCHSGTKEQIDPQLCSECHSDIYADWEESGHAESLGEGSENTRIMKDEQCQSCHVENAIKRRSDIDFQTKAIEIGQPDQPITCEACHAPPELGWFGHFGKDGDSLDPAGTGPHGSGDANVSSPETVCTACHSNSVVLQLANESKISPHSTDLNATVEGDTNDDVDPATATPTPTTEAPVPGFGIGVALAGILGAALLVRRYT